LNCKIILYALLREKLPPEAHGRANIELPEGTTIRDVMTQFQLPENSLCALNGQLERDLNCHIQDGDELRFFRASSGGFD
jgi:hypothetical protein